MITKKKAPAKRTAKNYPKANKQRSLRRFTTLQYMILFLLLLATIVALAVYARIRDHEPQPRLVTFHDRGQSRVILTHSATVRDALRDAGIRIEPQDVVEPLASSKLESNDSVVIVYRSRPVLIIDEGIRQKIITAAASPNEIVLDADMKELTSDDKATISEGDFIADGASQVLRIERAKPPDPIAANIPTPMALTANKGAQLFVDSNGVAHRETYYDLPMNVVMQHCGGGDYSIRYDGAKVDKDGYVLVAASYRNYPKCSIVETSMGLGKVYDTGGFALRYPHGFDLATDWTNFNGR